MNKRHKRGHNLKPVHYCSINEQSANTQDNNSTYPLKLKSNTIHFLPVEIVEMLFVIAAGCAVLFFSQTLYLPSLDAIFFIFKHYIGPLTLAVFLAVVVSIARTSFKQSKDFQLRMLRILATTPIILLLHFNFKLWSMLINPRRFDHVYQYVDLHLHYVERFLFPLRNALHHLLSYVLTYPYHELFIAMFFIAFWFSAISKRTEIFERVSTATMIVLSLGSVCYSVAPAFGPFIYRQGVDPVSTSVQKDMKVFMDGFLGSNGVLDPTFFVAGLGAMPSLHIANALVFAYFSLKLNKLLGGIFFLFTFYFCAEAVFARWHYWLDFPAGTVIAVIAILISNHFIQAIPQGK